MTTTPTVSPPLEFVSYKGELVNTKYDMADIFGSVMWQHFDVLDVGGAW